MSSEPEPGDGALRVHRFKGTHHVQTKLFNLRAGAAPLAFAVATLSVPAYAQTPNPVGSTPDNTGIIGSTADDNTAAGISDATVHNEDPSAIVVTGSRIARPDLTSASPVNVVTADQLRLSGKPGVEEFLRQIPQAVPSVGQNNNNGNEGVATINLRSLGAVRTLVLVDGQRFVPYDAQGIVDLNMIPSALIKRVDIVTGGASAVYGSDAVAGVVNFVLDHDFVGIQGDANLGISQRGDGAQHYASLTAGIKLGDRGHLIASGTYTKTAKVTQGQRNYSTFALAAADFSSGGSSTNEFGSLQTALGRYTFTSGGFLPYDSDRDSFNFNPQNLLQVPQEKYTATVLADYELTDNVEFFARGTYGKSKIRTEIGSSGTFGLTFDINYLTNPYLNPAIYPQTAGARAILALSDTGPGDDGKGVDKVAGDGIVSVGVRRRITELGPRASAYDSEAYQGVVGLKGDFGANKQLHWQIFGQYGKSIRNQAFLNDVSLTKLQQALLVVNGPNGPQCTDPSGGCVPANIYGLGTLSPAAANFIKFSISEKDTNQQIVAGGFVNGDLPFGFVDGHPAAFSLGVEYRKEKAFNLPDDNYIQGNAVGYGASSIVKANFDVKEVYGEVNVPILADRPFFQSLGVEGGFRYSSYHNATKVYLSTLDQGFTQYRNSFNNFTYKAGANWQIDRSVMIRAMYQRAVRAPNLQEIGQPATSGTGDALFDPCAAGTYKATDTTLTQLCRTVGGGIAANLVGNIPQPTSGQVNNFSGGNPNLVPEKADTLTIGGVFTPPFLRGFTASIDYYDIKVKKAILATPEQAILDACYYAQRDPNGLFCSLIKRNQGDGSLEGDFKYGVDSSKRNIGLIQSRGIDIAANYNTEVMTDTRLLLGINLTYTLENNFQYASVLRTYNCAGLVGKTCQDTQPRLAFVQTTGLEYKKALIQLTWRYIGKLTNDTITGDVGYNFQSASDFVVPRIKPVSYFDLNVRFKISDDFNFRLGVDNIGDVNPPVVGNDYGGTTQNSGNTFPATYDPLGRYFHAGVTFKFF